MLSRRQRLRRRQAIRREKVRSDTRRRTLMAEQLEPRVAPGSMFVDVLKLIAPAMVLAQHAEVATVQANVTPASNQSQGTSVGHVDRNLSQDIHQEAAMRRKLESAVVAQRREHLAERARVADSDPPTSTEIRPTPRDRPAPRERDLWFRESTGLVADGLDDGLDDLLDNDRQERHGGRSHQRALGPGPALNSGLSASSNSAPHTPSLEIRLASRGSMSEAGQIGGGPNATPSPFGSVSFHNQSASGASAVPSSVSANSNTGWECRTTGCSASSGPSDRDRFCDPPVTWRDTKFEAAYHFAWFWRRAHQLEHSRGRRQSHRTRPGH